MIFLPATGFIYEPPTQLNLPFLRLGLEPIRPKGVVPSSLTMVFKLALEASKTWKRLKGYKLILKVLEGEKFVNGELEEGVAA